MALTGYSTTNFLSITSTAAIVAAAPVTVACWAYSPAVAAFQNILGLYNSGSPENRNCFKVQLSNTGSVRASVATNGSEAFADGSVATNNTWFHVAGVFNSTTSRSVFLNGGGKATNTTSVTPALIINRIFVGCGGGLTMGTPMNSGGRIAECGMWNVALSDAEIAQLATGISARLIRPESLFCYMPLVRDIVAPKFGGLTLNGTLSAVDHPRILF